MALGRIHACLAAVFAAAVLLSSVPASGKDDYASITPEAYPDNDAVVILSKMTHTFQLYLLRETSLIQSIAARTEIERTMIVKFLDSGAFDRLGNFQSPIYNKDFSEYKVEARVTDPSGKEKKVGKDDIKRIDIGEKYFRYKIAFPGLQVGSVVEVSEKLKSDYPILGGSWDFAEDVPTLRSEFTFRVPKGSNVIFGSTPEHSIDPPEPSEDGRYDSYEIVKENIAPYVREPYMSIENIGNPTLHYHVWSIPNAAVARAIGVPPQAIGGKPYTQNWNDIGKIFNSYFDPDRWETNEKAGDYREKIEGDIDRFRGLAIDVNREKLCSLLSWFREEFQPVDDELFYFRSDPEETFETKEGGPFDLAYAFNYILRDIGLRPEIMLVREADKGLLNRKMPAVNAFNHALILIEDQGTQYWIDPFSHYCAMGQIPWKCRGVEAMHLLPAGKSTFTVIPLADPKDNCIERSIKAGIDEAGDLSGTVDMVMTGQYLLKLREDVDEDDDAAFQEALKDMIRDSYPQSFDDESLEILENGIDTLKVEYSLSIPGCADIAGGYINIDFSRWFSRSLADAFKNEERTTDMQFPFLSKDITSVEIKLPDGAALDTRPEDIDLDGGRFSYSRKIAFGENLISFMRELDVRAPTVPRAEYQSTREFVNKVYKLDNEAVILREGS